MSETVLNVQWSARCKDCEREAAAANGDTRYSYPDAYRTRLYERGETPSDRCPRHRLQHRRDLRAMPVPYIEVETVGALADPSSPTGALGHLGPLPVEHDRRERPLDLGRFDFGLRDEHVLELLGELAGAAGKRVAVVAAGTGSGKSTFLPFRLLNPPPGAPLRLADHGPIVVTEPRVFATTDVAEMVALRLGLADVVGAGSEIGYKVRGNPAYDAGCRLLFVTDGSLINWMRDGALARLGTVVIDEAHERSRNIDLILAILRAELPRHPHLRVIIASATIDPGFFVDFFGGADKVAVLEVDARKTFGYGEPLWPGVPFVELGGAWSDPAQREAARVAAELRVLDGPVDRARWREDMPRLVAEQLARIALGTPSGDALGFLATGPQIVEAKQRLESLVGDAAEVYGLLRSASEEHQRAAREPRPPGAPRRLVIATNIAETSLTIEGLSFVVDSGLICQSEWDAATGTGRLPTKPHSQQGVRQRWGRVGRNAPGLVFPLYTREQFEQVLPVSTPPEATRDDLEGLVLQAAAMGYSDPRALRWPAAHRAAAADDRAQRENEARAQVFEHELERAGAALRARGAITGQGDPTETGLELLAFTGSMLEAAVVSAADQLSCAVEALTALALLAQTGLLRFERSAWSAPGRLAALRRHDALRDGCQDDLDLVLRVFARWERAADPSAWARRHAVNESALKKAAAKRDEWLAFLSPGRAEVCQPVRPVLAPRVRAAFAHALADRRYERVGDGWRPVADPQAEPASLDRRTLVAGKRIVAVRQSLSENGKLRLGGVMIAPEWACEAGGILELALACARHAGERDERPFERAFALESAWPIGSVHRCAYTRRGGEERLRSLAQLRPGVDDPLVFEPPPTRAEAEPVAGAQIVPLHPEIAVVDEEQEPRFAHLANEEPADDELAAGAAAAPADAAEASARVAHGRADATVDVLAAGAAAAPADAAEASARVAHGRADATVDVLVLGWEGADAERTVVVAALETASEPPARGATLAFAVGERVDWAGPPFLVVRAGAWESAVTASDLSPANDRNLLDRLDPTEPLKAEVTAVAGGMLRVSTVAAALRDLAAAPRSARVINGESAVTGRVTATEPGFVHVTLDAPERRGTRIPLRFQARQYADDGQPGLEDGAAVDVRLAQWREKDPQGGFVDPVRTLPGDPDGLQALCEASEAIELDGGSLIARAPVPADVKAALLALGDDGAWAAAIEDLWQRSHRLRVISVRSGHGAAPTADGLRALAAAKDTGERLAGEIVSVDRGGVYVSTAHGSGRGGRGRIGPHGAADPREHFKPGDTVTIVVEGVEPVMLSIPDAVVVAGRDLTTVEDVLRILPAGTRKRAIVTRVADDAVYLDVAYGLSGRLASELFETPPARNDAVEVTIEEAFLERSKNLVRLRVSPAPDQPEPAPAAPVHQTVRDARALVDRALGILVRHLAPVVEGRLAARLGPAWATSAARRLNKTPAEFKLSDPYFLLAVLRDWWFDAGFASTAGREAQPLVLDVAEVRNLWAHYDPISEDRLEQTFANAAALLRSFGIDAEEELRDALPPRVEEAAAPVPRRPATLWLDPRLAEALEALRHVTPGGAVAPDPADPDALVVALVADDAAPYGARAQDVAHALRARLGAPLTMQVVRDRGQIRYTVADYLRHLVPRDRWPLLSATTIKAGGDELHVLVHPELRPDVRSGDDLLALARALGFELAVVHYGIPNRS